LFPRKREVREHDFSYLLDCRLRGNDTLRPTSLRSQPTSIRGEANCFIRLKYYAIPHNSAKIPRRKYRLRKRFSIRSVC